MKVVNSSRRPVKQSTEGLSGPVGFISWKRLAEEKLHKRPGDKIVGLQVNEDGITIEYSTDLCSKSL